MDFRDSNLDIEGDLHNTTIDQVHIPPSTVSKQHPAYSSKAPQKLELGFFDAQLFKSSRPGHRLETQHSVPSFQSHDESIISTPDLVQDVRTPSDHGSVSITYSIHLYLLTCDAHRAYRLQMLLALPPTIASARRLPFQRPTQS